MSNSDLTTFDRTADGEAYDAFVDQWFRDVVLPQYRLREVRRQRDGEGWRIAARLVNVGSGAMPVEVAAVRGERFGDAGRPMPEYRDARTSVILTASESRQIEILATFEPEKLVVDPDVQVLQLHRADALARF